MAIRKRGSGWQIDYFDPTGKRVRKSFAKKKNAEAELAKRVSLIVEKRYLDVKKDYTTTLDDILRWLVMSGANLKTVQELLGHKNITMTMRYAHLSQEHKKEAVNLLNGRAASQNPTCHKSVTTLSVIPRKLNRGERI